MKKFLLAAVLAAGMGFGAIGHAEDAPKPVDVKVCPMSQEAVKGDGAGSEVVGNYKVFFCCGGCKGNFDKLSAEEKTKKVEAALKVQEDAKKG